MSPILYRQRNSAEQVDYESDLVLWIEGQAALLRAKEFDLLDLPNVIEEFGDIGQRQERDLTALIRDLTFQKLGLEVEPDFIISPQLATSAQQRDEILSILGRSPSLADRIQEYVSKTYGDALRFAERHRDRPQRRLSRECPYSAEQLIGKSFSTIRKGWPADDYTVDFLRWNIRQTELLSAKDFQRLDLSHVIKELDELAAGERRELQARLKALIAYLLKCQFQEASKAGEWRFPPGAHRTDIRLRLEQSPSLTRTITDDMERVYPRAVDAASQETGLPKNTFPPKSPYSVTQLFDYDFFP